jgi:hypothetical protein
MVPDRFIRNIQVKGVALELLGAFEVIEIEFYADES